MFQFAQQVVRERELLDHDRDIRELMGSRDLYIAEVYDVAKTGIRRSHLGGSSIPVVNHLSSTPTISISSQASSPQVPSRFGDERGQIAIMLSISASFSRTTPVESAGS
jgi:hypothetical protein